MIRLRTSYLQEMSNSTIEVPLRPSGTYRCRPRTTRHLSLREMQMSDRESRAQSLSEARRSR